MGIWLVLFHRHSQFTCMPIMKGKNLKLTGVEDCDFCRQHVGVDEVYEKGEKQIRLDKQQRNKADDVGDRM